MTDLHRAIFRELADARMTTDRMEQLLHEEMPVHDLAHILIDMGRLNEDLAASVERLESRLVPEPEDAP